MLSDIELLGEIRCEYNLFDEKEKPYYEALTRAIKALNNRGTWKYNDKDDIICYCSECLMPQDTETNYCHNCGAKMDGEEKKDD